MNVPFIDLKAQNRKLKSEILPLWEEIFESASFIGGHHVISFEKEFARACEVDHAVAVSSGTDALRFIFLALDLREGDEIITVPNTFIATTEAISQAGGKIVFVDINPETYNIDASKIESAITSKTKGIVPVHLYGQTADMDSIMTVAEKYGLWVVEDACQAHLAEYKGCKAGSMGIASGFSFYPGKNLGACGEGGAVTTNDSAIAEKVRILRDHGQGIKYYHKVEGFNGRCDALQAAVLRVKLKHLPDWNEDRRRNAQRYIDFLKDVDAIVLPKVADECLSVYHLFVVQLEERDRIAKALNAKGIGTGLHYPLPLHFQKAYAYLGLQKGPFPKAEACASRVLSLPMFPELNEEQIVYIGECIKEIVSNS